MIPKVRKLKSCCLALAGLVLGLLTSCDRTSGKLTKPLGILTTNGSGFFEFVPAGGSLPVVYSYPFVTSYDDQAAVEISVVQRDASGQEIITYAQIDGLPPRPAGKLNVVLTVSIDQAKRLYLKATVPETAYVKELGPFPVK